MRIRFTNDLDEEEMLEFNKFLHHLKQKRGITDLVIDDDTAIKKQVIDELINTPQTENFIEAVKSEMAHHPERWGDESMSSPGYFQSVISHLIGKLIKSIWDKDGEKFKHHLITIAAVAGTAKKYFDLEGSAVYNWFKQE